MTAARLRTVEGGRIGFKCPGCGDNHVLPVSPQAGPGPSWDWNGDLARPTLSPSILARRGHFANGLSGPDPKGCACNFAERFPAEEPWPWPCGVCHSFVRDGRIEFLSDCTHALAGQTVDLPELEP